jgi:hypothetical protein
MVHRIFERREKKKKEEKKQEKKGQEEAFSIKLKNSFL